MRDDFKAPVASLRSKTVRVGPGAGLQAQSSLRGYIWFRLNLPDRGGRRSATRLQGSQSSGADWSKSAGSSSQESEARGEGCAGVRGGALGGRPMQVRIRFAMVGSVIAAISRIEWPHSHRRAFTPKIRFSKSAQGRRRGRGRGPARTPATRRSSVSWTTLGARDAGAGGEAMESDALSAPGAPPGGVIGVIGPASPTGVRQIRGRSVPQEASRWRSSLPKTVRTSLRACGTT